MAKKQPSEISEPRPDIHAAKYATAVKLPMLNKDGEATLIEGLRKLGASFSSSDLKANDFHGGKVPFARKVKVTGFTFITDLTN